MTFADPRVEESDLFDRVRSFKVHDEIHGGYVPVIVGYWDNLGYTRCLDHAPESAAVLQAIWCDNSAVEGDRCDWPGCGVSILAAAIKRHERQQPFPSACCVTPVADSE